MHFDFYKLFYKNTCKIATYGFFGQHKKALLEIDVYNTLDEQLKLKTKLSTAIAAVYC